MSTVEEITAAINAKGEEIRVLKAANPPTLKDDIKPLVAELLALKVSYKEVTGEEFGGAKPEKKKPAEGGTEEETGEAKGPSKGELKKEARKAEKLAKRAEAREASGVAAPVTAAGAEDVDEFARFYGDYPLIQSSFMSEKAYRHVEDLSAEYVGQSIWVRARVSTSRAVGKGIFLVLRQNINTIQAVMFQGSKVSKQMVKYAAGISLESVIDVFATVSRPDVPVAGATISNLELQITEIHVVSRAQDLPFLVEDAGRNEAEALANQLPIVSQDLALDFRWIDTRTPANQSIFRIQSGVCQLFREYFISKRFVEVHTPKLLGGASEGGSSVFRLSYFDRPACLAQSPQFYKQMTSACGGFDRVFEIGPVFRAENSNTHR
jgi:lysyl-tRNA synthetase class II